MTDGGVLRRGDVLWRILPDAVMIRIPGGEPILVTGSGTALWRALAEPATFADLVGRLAREHDTAPERVAADIEPVVSDLLDRGVLRDD